MRLWSGPSQTRLVASSVQYEGVVQFLWEKPALLCSLEEHLVMVSLSHPDSQQQLFSLSFSTSKMLGLLPPRCQSRGHCQALEMHQFPPVSTQSVENDTSVLSKVNGRESFQFQVEGKTKNSTQNRPAQSARCGSSHRTLIRLCHTSRPAETTSRYTWDAPCFFFLSFFSL